ncbi:hypothetical protein BKA08_002202 [Nocardioides marinisabuli]|uniref:AAA domain-containing protein n=1 Tax=Nocardioides marinisabuli TaxID=419476 RepID=A0A7Y9F1U2_9ACTN|nr:AAA family ATPase [Nocardioides marinisabuli]NYD57964.1 hypothetical protein [Nocardioides marinisabuli]
MTGELLLITGPPAVGKMTVGRAICARSDYRLFHNHHTVEPLLEVFGHGTPAFEQLTLEFRRRVLEEAAEHGLKLVFTLVWGVDDPADADLVRQMIAPFREAGLPVRWVELYADLETRLARNSGADRIAAKPSKADLAWSDAHVRDVDRRLRMNTDPADPTLADELLADVEHLRLDNAGLTADEAAQRVLAWLEPH